MQTRSQKRKARAAMRNHLRTIINAKARNAAIPPPPPPRKNRRCTDVLDLLISRSPPSITPQQFSAGLTFKGDWFAQENGQVLGYDRLGSNMSPADSTEHRIHAIAMVNQALRAVGPRLEPIIMHVLIANDAPAKWAEERGKPSPDGIALLREGLDALHDHYLRRRRM